MDPSKLSLLQRLHLRRPHKWEPPTLLDSLLASPLQLLITHIYHLILFLRGRPFYPSTGKPPIRIVSLSDTHDSILSNVPDGDLLVHAGDTTNDGSVAAIQRQLDWLAALPHEHKVLVVGNHDSWFDARSRREVDIKSGAKVELGPIHYLQDQSVTLRFANGRVLNVYGAADIPACGGPENAFQYVRESPPWKDRIPRGTELLVTHTPPRYHLDLTLGCAGLLQELWRVRPRVHIFGHVHWGRGRESAFFDDCQQAYENLMARGPRDPIADLIPSAAWLDALRVIYFGASSILWKWLMQGPGSNNATLLVNTAIMYGNTGKPGHQPQVVEM